MPRVELIYIPLHRSYTDFLLTSDMLASMGLSPPHVVTGEDFLGLGKLANLMRGSGSFFMRRSFRGDALYTALFKKYIHQLMIRCLPIEFFIEAMRSRTGKTKAPKLGMLKFIMDVFFDSKEKGLLDDVLFVPISISYDEVLEAKIFAEELLGIPKPRENISNMIKAYRNLKHRYGNIYMHFGDAISLREFTETWSRRQSLPVPGKEGPSPITLQDRDTNLDPSVGVNHSTENAGSCREYKPPAALLGSLGWHIAHKLQENIVITPAAVVASAVECAMPICEAEGIGLSLTRLHTTIVMLIEAVKQRGGNLSPIFYASSNGDGINRSTDKTKPSHMLAPTPDISRITHQGMENLHRFLSVQSGNAEVGEVLYYPPTSTSRLGVHISANQLVHVFIDEAVLAVVAHGYGTLISSSIPGSTARAVKLTVLVDKARLLRQLLSKEFPDFSQSCPDSFDAWMQRTLARFQLDNVKQCGPDNQHQGGGREAKGKSDLILVPITQLNDFLLQLIFPYIDILYMVCVATYVLLETFPEQPLFSKLMMTVIFKTALSLFEEQNVIKYVTACNNDTVKNCLDSLLELPLMQNRSKNAPLGEKQGKPMSESSSPIDKSMFSQISELISQLQHLRWIKSMDPGEEMQAVKKKLLRCYADMCEGAKL